MLRISGLLPFLLALSPPLAAEPANYRLLHIDDRPVKWGAPQLGREATVSYAFVKETTRFPDARNCQEMAPLAALAGAASLSEAALMDEAARAFTLWEAAANVKFVKADSVEDADILIGAEPALRGSARADVQAGKDSGPIGVLQRGLICLSTAQHWKIGFGGSSDAQDLRYTLAHEIGHTLGLNHPGPAGELMSFHYGESFSGLQPGDIAGAVVLYGPARIVTEHAMDLAGPAGSQAGR